MSNNDQSKQSKEYDKCHKNPSGTYICGKCVMIFYEPSKLDFHVKECQKDRKNNNPATFTYSGKEPKFQGDFS